MPMQIPELEDQQWFPNILRQQQMDFIGFVVQHFPIYQPAIKLLQQLLISTKHNTITDCCSGGGGPILYLQKNISVDVSIVLTDLYPQPIENLPPNIRYEKMPVNILEPNYNCNGIITMFNAFHHLNCIEKNKFLKRIIETHNPIFIAEILSPTPISFLTILFTTTVGQLMLTPFIKPFKFSRIIFTYLFPINLITVCWDGLASVLKSSSYPSLNQLAQSLSTTNYNFTCIKAGNLFTPLYVLKGEPIT